MADFTKDVIDQLKITNQKLDNINEAWEKGDTPASIIKHALPEVIIEKKIADKQQKEGLLKVDDHIKEQSKKQEDQH